MSDVLFLERKVVDLKIKTLEMIHRAGSGHCGGSLSAAEIISVLYYKILNIDPNNPQWPDRDRFIASKGHCAPILYAALAARGYFSETELGKLRRIGSMLQGHPDMKKTPGVDMSTGSLGLGLSAGIGMALSARLQGKSYRTYVLMGDGEVQEGQVWEAAMSAVKYRIDSLVAVLDRNGVQLDGRVQDIMPAGDLCEKWRSFGWNVVDVDGHSVSGLLDAFKQAADMKGRPTIIIARTIKGKGVSFMEGRHEWHGKPLTGKDFEDAMKEMGGGWT